MKTIEEKVSTPSADENKWILQAECAIENGQFLNVFLSHCHPDNRKEAILAAKYVIKRKKDALLETCVLYVKCLDSGKYVMMDNHLTTIQRISRQINRWS